ncbi:MAG: hypothetical protein HQK75_18310 [Candidatus Magnetomorum sp.]|nr:hypothetical protein [Candidatus Magnetomorum sp.]
MEIRGIGETHLCLIPPDHTTVEPVYIQTINDKKLTAKTIEIDLSALPAKEIHSPYNTSICSTYLQFQPQLEILHTKDIHEVLYQCNPCKESFLFKALAGDFFYYHLIFPDHTQTKCLNLWYHPLSIPKNLDRQYSVSLTCKTDHVTNSKDAVDFFSKWSSQLPQEKVDHIFGSPDFFYYLFQLTENCDQKDLHSSTVFSFCSSYTRVWSESITINKDYEQFCASAQNHTYTPTNLLFENIRKKLTPAIKKVQEFPSYKKSRAYRFFKDIEQ